jgi:hypothetical protein
VANDDVAPLLRYRLGEVATDVDSIRRGTFAKFGQTKHLEVPIYYVPIHPKHRDKVDNYAWSVIYGANVAYWIHTKFSRWTRPDQYYVSFPDGMMDPKEVLEHRSLLRKSAPFYFSHNGKTVKDGVPVSFVLNPDRVAPSETCHHHELCRMEGPRRRNAHRKASTRRATNLSKLWIRRGFWRRSRWDAAGNKKLL